MSQPLENLEPQQPDVNSTQQADSSTPQNVVQGNQNRSDSNYLKLEFEELEHNSNYTKPKKQSSLTVIV